MALDRFKSTRYRAASAFQPDANGHSVFPGIRARPIGSAEGVLEHQLKEGERLDLLALNYYNDSRLWWRIVDANPQLLCGLDVSISRSIHRELVGSIILIPRADDGRAGGG
jgi:hypothetical protein